MVDQARASQPTPPIALALTPAAPVRARFESFQVAVPDAVLDRLRNVCPAVDTSLPTRADAGRDWWPVTVGWALKGEVPALAAAVARPADAAEVAAVLALCNEAGIPVTAMGGRSGVCGGSVPVFGGLQLDLTGLTGVRAVDHDSMLIDVGPGTFGDGLEAWLRSEHGLTLGHWPQSIALSTVGGWIACRGAGQYSTRYGKIEDMVAGLEVALADGTLIRTGGAAPRAATGPDLTGLFVGSEGTLGVITAAQLRAHPLPPAERRAAFGFPSFAAGLQACRRILQRGATPAVLRLYDEHESRRGFAPATTDKAATADPATADPATADPAGADPAGADHALIVLDEGDPGLIDAVMTVVAEECAALGARCLDPALVQRWLDRRDDISALETAVRAGLTVDTIEVAARWAALPDLYSDVIAAMSAVDGTFLASAHQSHAYTDGACLYFTFAGKGGDAYYTRVWDQVMTHTLAHGAAISHHHGIGLNRGRYLAQALGPAFEVLVALKHALDPHGILNPGKLGLPSPFGEVPWP